MLGIRYYDGKGVSQSYEEAVKLFTLAADQVNVDAQGILGEMYYKGEGTEKDNKALDYFRQYYDDDDLIIENDVLYSSDKSIIYDYYGPDLEIYEIPDSVKIIRNGAFFNHVKSVYVPKDYEIEDGAFD